MAAGVRRALDSIVFAVGLIADGFRGWQIIIKGAEVAILNVELAMSRANDAIRNFLGTSEESIQQQIDSLEEMFAIQARGLNDDQAELLRETVDLQIAALDIERSRTGELEGQVALAELQLRQLSDTVPFYEQFAEAAEKARMESQAAAEATAAIAQQRSFIPPEVGVAEGAEEQAARERAEREAEADRARLQSKLERVREFTMTELELEQAAITTRLETIRLAFEDELIAQEEFYTLSAEIAERGQDEITRLTQEGLTARERFAKLSTQAQTAHVLGQLATMTAGVAQSNKTMFNLNKLAAIGSAVVNTAQGVTRALAEYPPPLSFAMAAAQAAAGAVQIQAIKSTSFGGGTTPSAAGAAPTVNNFPVSNELPNVGGGTADRGSRIEINIAGSVVGTEGAESLVDFIQDALTERLEDRDEVIFTQNSRQATVGAA